MAFTTEECAWAQTSVTVLGRKISGIRGWEFNREIETELLYAQGSDPIDIQDGNKRMDGNLKLLKYEVDLLNDAANAAGYQSIIDVPHNLISITCTFKKYPSSRMRTVTAGAVRFNKLSVAMEQNAKMAEITLPFLAMELIWS